MHQNFSFQCCPDIFSSGFWSSENSGDFQVNQLKQKLKLTALTPRASKTSENYLRAFNRWREFASGVSGVHDFPVSLTDCALYLQYLLESSKSASSINCTLYTFKWLHQIAGVDSPMLHPTVIAVKEEALRLVSQPASQRKGPLEVIHLKQLAEKTDFDNLLP